MLKIEIIVQDEIISKTISVPSRNLEYLIRIYSNLSNFAGQMNKQEARINPVRLISVVMVFRAKVMKNPFSLISPVPGFLEETCQNKPLLIVCKAENGGFRMSLVAQSQI